MRQFILTILTLAFLGASFGSPAKADDTGGLVGGIIGAGLGAFFGNGIGHGAGRELATLGGAVLGGVVGNRIGSTFDNMGEVHAAMYAPSVSMYSDERPASVYVPNYVAPPAPTPASLNTYNTAADIYCSAFAQQFVAGGQIRQTYVTACRQPDGSWVVLQ